MDGQNPYYVGIHNPKNIRRELLGCSKSVIVCLKRFERLRGLRENKYITANGFRDKVREINFLIDKLNKILPKSDVESLPISKISEPKPMRREELPPQELSPKYEEMSELQRLEADLERIEARLEGLR